MYDCASLRLEGVLDALVRQLLGRRAPHLDHLAQLLACAVVVAGLQPRHADADQGIDRVGLELERGAKLLLGGAGPALLEEPPAGVDHLLRLRGRGGRGGGGLVLRQVALLVLLPRAARALVVAAGVVEAGAGGVRGGVELIGGHAGPARIPRPRPAVTSRRPRARSRPAGARARPWARRRAGSRGGARAWPPPCPCRSRAGPAPCPRW